MATVSRHSTTTPSFGARLLGVLWRLVKVMLALLLGLLLGSMLWLGARFVQESLLIPIQANQRAITTLERDFQAERDATTKALAERDARITTLERELADERARVRELSTMLEMANDRIEQLTTTQQEQTDRLEGLTTELAQMHDALATLQTEIATLEAQDETQARQLEAIQEQITQLALELNAMSSDIADLQLAVLAPTGRVAQVEERLMLLQAAGNLINAQRELDNQDLGDTRTYLALAEADLQRLWQQSNDPQRREALETLMTRIEAIVSLLDEDPVAAQAEMLALWRTLHRLSSE